MGTSPSQTPNPIFLTPDLSEFIQRRMREVSASINACQIGTVAGINANGTITASVNFQKIVRGTVPIPNSNIMGDQIINYPSLVNVPVFVYQGGGAAILMPIKVGDDCLILFCDRDMDNWFENATIAPPNSDRVHSINDAIALVGINNSLSLFPPNTSGVIQIFDSTGERLSQSGMMSAYAGTTAPNGWLFCQGQAVSRTTYSFLFAVIGTTYGDGDGSSTFNIPNMQGQVPVGLLPGDPNFGTLGTEVGEQEHTLIISEMPAHAHGLTWGQINAGVGNGYQFYVPFQSPPGNGSTYNNGSDAPHNNIQPSLVVNWIIKI